MNGASYHNLLGHKVIIHSNRSRYQCIVSEIGPSFIEVIEIGRGCTKIFNLDRIDYIEDLGC